MVWPSLRPSCIISSPRSGASWVVTPSSLIHSMTFERQTIFVTHYPQISQIAKAVRLVPARLR